MLTSRSDEVDVRKISMEEQEMFHGSDKLVRVLTGSEATKARQRYPERVLSSRMARRRKPLAELGAWKPKSRRCIHGHTDPDTGTPMLLPPSRGHAAVHAGVLEPVHHFSFCDVRNAFCQSDKLRRPGGPIFAEQCEGLHLPPGALIAIDVPVYGLNDAPAAWRRTIADYYVSEGYVRNLIEPCWYMLYDKDGNNVPQVLVEVDDLIVTTAPDVKKRLQEPFVFGKWEDRRIRILKDCILVDQEKCILEQLKQVTLAKGRRSERQSSLTDEEFKNFRSAFYRINWVAKESRPEMSGMASILASRLQHATISDVLILNKAVNHLRNTAAWPLKICKFAPRDMAFIVVSDAEGINTKEHELDELGLPAHSTQGAWTVLSAEALPIGSQAVRASPMAWRSSKLKRKVFSTFGGETQAMLQGINEADWLQIMYTMSS